VEHSADETERDNEIGDATFSLTRRDVMPGTPNTVGVLLLFVGVFLASLLWASHGHTATTDPEEEDVQTPGKTS